MTVSSENNSTVKRDGILLIDVLGAASFQSRLFEIANYSSSHVNALMKIAPRTLNTMGNVFSHT